MKWRDAVPDPLFFGSYVYDLLEPRKVGMLWTIVLLLALALASCAPSKAQTQAAQYVTASTPMPVFVASPEIANKPGYLELNVYVANRSGSPIPGLKHDDFIADTSGGHLPIAFFHENVRTPMKMCARLYRLEF